MIKLCEYKLFHSFIVKLMIVSEHNAQEDMDK